MSDERIDRLEKSQAKLDGFVDGFRVVPQIALAAVGVVMAVVGLILTIGIFQLNSMSTQLREVSARVDGLPKHLTDEFRAMRSEMAAQTSAIANSVTAARQMQPQLLILPPPPPPPAAATR